MRAAVILMAALLPLPALAEGARIELTCDTRAACDAAGQCDAQGDVGENSVGDPAPSGPASGDLRLVIEPEDTDPDGIGLYSMWVGDGPALGAAGAGRLGPYLWMDDDGTRSTLALTGEDSAILIRQGAGGADPARVDFLHCTVIY